MSSAVFAVRFRILDLNGDIPPGAKRVRRVLVAGDQVIVEGPNGYPEGDTGWVSFWPLGRQDRPNVWIFARRVTDPGQDEAWVWALPDDPVVDRGRLRAVWDELRTELATRTFSLAEVGRASDGLAKRIRDAWPDKRPRRRRTVSVGADGVAVTVDDGPDTRLPKVALYRGIGSAEGARLRPVASAVGDAVVGRGAGDMSAQ